MYLYIRKSVWDKGAISLGMGVFSCPWTAEEQKWRNHECIQKYPCTRNSGCDAGWLKCLNISSSSNSLSLLPSWHLGAPAWLRLCAGYRGQCQLCACSCGTGCSVTFSLCCSWAEGCKSPPVSCQTAFVPAVLPCQWFPSLWGKAVVSNLGLHAITSPGLFPNLNYCACSRRNSVILGRREIVSVSWISCM